MEEKVETSINKKVIAIISIVVLIIVAIIGTMCFLVQKDNKQIAAIKEELSSKLTLENKTVEYGAKLVLSELNLPDEVKLYHNDQEVTEDYTFNEVGEVTFVEVMKVHYHTFLQQIKEVEEERVVVYTVEDTKKPILEGIENKEITVGDSIDLKAGVTARDEVDGALEFITEGEVDTNTPGEYKIVVKAVDKNGLETMQEFAITVTEKVEVQNKSTQTTSSGSKAKTSTKSSGSSKSNGSTNKSNSSSKGSYSWQTETNGNTGKILGGDNYWQEYNPIQLTPEQIQAMQGN